MKKIERGKIFRAYNGFLIVSDIGSGFIGRIKGFLPDLNRVVLELAAWTILLSHWSIVVPDYFLIAIIIGQEYFWMVIYYFGGMWLKKTGYVRASNEYEMQHLEDLKPFNMEMADSIEEICKKLGIESKFNLYKDMRIKREAELKKLSPSATFDKDKKVT